MCIDNVEFWFGIAHWQILSVVLQLSAGDMIMAGYYHFTFLYPLYCSRNSVIRESEKSIVSVISRKWEYGPI